MKESVQEYYGRVLQTSKDLKTNACCGVRPPQYIRDVLALINDEVMAKYYGCGITIPQDTLEGLSVLDLGSGSGQDVFVASRLVGEAGECVGIDMTDEQLEVARKYVEYHREKFSYAKSNVRFVKGYIEKLDEAGLADNSFDMIMYAASSLADRLFVELTLLPALTASSTSPLIRTACCSKPSEY